MEATNFEQANMQLGPPAGMTEDEVRTLRVYRGRTEEGHPYVISCFKPTQEEIDEIQRTGRIWLTVLGTLMQPVLLESTSPWDQEGWAKKSQEGVDS